MEITTKTIINLLDIAQNLSSIIISVSVSIFTLTVAFLVSKAEDLGELYKEINRTGISQSNQKKARDSKNFFVRMKRVTANALIALVISIIALFSCIATSFLDTSFWTLLVFIPVAAAIAYVGISLAELIKWYWNFHKNH